MANIIIKSDERRTYEAKVRRSFGVDSPYASKERREAADFVAARSQEAYKELKKMEEKKR